MNYSKNNLFQNSVLLGSALIISSLAAFSLIKNTTKVNAAAPCIVTIFGKQYDVNTLGTTHSGPKGTTQINFGGNTFFQCGGDMTALYQGMHGTSVSKIASLMVSPNPTAAPTISPTTSPSPSVAPSTSPTVAPSTSPTATPSVTKHDDLDDDNDDLLEEIEDELEDEMDDDHDDDRKDRQDDHHDDNDDDNDDDNESENNHRRGRDSKNQSSDSLRKADNSRHDD